MAEIQSWLDRIVSAQSNEDVFSILDEFRPLLWSDEERAKMAKVYNAKLYQNWANQGLVKGKQVGKEEKIKSSTNISREDAGNQRGESISSQQELDEDIE